MFGTKHKLGIEIRCGDIVKGLCHTVFRVYCLLLVTLPMLLNQCYTNGLGNLDNLGSNEEI